MIISEIGFKGTVIANVLGGIVIWRKESLCHIIPDGRMTSRKQHVN